MKFFTLFLLIVGATFLVHAQEDGWKLSKDKNGISIYLKAAEGSALKDYRASMNVKASIEEVSAIIFDVSTYPEWTYKVKTSELIKTEGEKIFYYIVAKAPMVSDRDAVAVMEKSSDGEYVRFDFKAANDLKAEVDGLVRITDMHGYWKLKDNGDGTTYVQQFVHTDPGGNIPDWLANTTSTDNPYTTFSELKALLEQ